MQSSAVLESPGDTFVHFPAGAPFAHLGIFSPNLKRQCFKRVELAAESSKIGATVGICVVSRRQELELLTNLSSFSIISSQVVSWKAFEDVAEFLTLTKQVTVTGQRE